MKTCKKCQKEFKSSATVEGKRISLTGRSYCLECSPFGVHYGYRIRSQNTIAKNAKTNGKKLKVCPICSREFFDKHKNLVCCNCRGWYQRYRNKTAIYELLGNKCVKCGESNPDTFNIHHKDPKTKSFTMSGAWQLAMSTLIKEAQKCEIMCANCHAKEHCVYRKDIIEYYSKTYSK